MGNLPEIKDIHIPESVSLFPLAYGWWVILAGIIFAFFIIKAAVWSIKRSRKHYALKKLKNISLENPIKAAIEMSELLKRICHVRYKEALSLYGKPWIDFLNEHTSFKLNDEAASLLMFAPFMKSQGKNIKEKTAVELKEFCQKWIGANL